MIAAGFYARLAYDNTKKTAVAARRRLADETGEIGSWLIFAALIAAAAAIAGGIIADWFQEKAGDVADN
jgi:uncharacterized membrane protein YraQ (UPF0718 family)